jgi:hypothetical protein
VKTEAEALPQQMEARPAAAQPAEPKPMAPQAVEPKTVAIQPETPRVDTREMLESAGLQMVETRSDRASPAPQPEESVQLGRPRRERTRPAGEEQLVQVETKH